ncbi:hypothetical protein MASR1M45_22830 [Candidatus Kapaibacterium sp.]
MNKKAAICEFGDSHDDILYGQFEFLKRSGYRTYFISNRKLEDRVSNYDNIDSKLFLDFGKGQSANFYQIYKTWQFIKSNLIDKVILNTIEGTPVRNFCLFPFGKTTVAGIIHNAGNLTGNSFTFDRIIKPKIKKMFTLAPYIWGNSGNNADIKNEHIYPIKYPKHEITVRKPEGEFWLVIPGLVEKDRRDYLTFLDSIKGKSLPTNLKIILLGKSMHKNGAGALIKEFLTANSLSSNFVLFDNFVENSVFRDYVMQADLFAPLIHPGKGNFESYSTNKTSGTYLLAYANNAPLMCHEYFLQYPDICDSSVFYNLDNLYEILIDAVKKPDIIKNIRANIQNNQNFDFEFNRKKYISLIEL